LDGAEGEEGWRRACAVKGVEASWPTECDGDELYVLDSTMFARSEPFWPTLGRGLRVNCFSRTGSKSTSASGLVSFFGVDAGKAV
jgi:hypothetical protein